MEFEPWVEKYRPKSIDAIYGHTQIITYLRSCLTKTNFPHLMFVGSAGTGKTATTISFINDIYLYKCRKDRVPSDAVLLRNASEKNRVRDNDEIKDFVFAKSLDSRHPYKFVVLDEADSMTGTRQFILRRVLEMAPPNVKFIFMCNDVENIIDPILSRCAVFFFSPLPIAQTMINLRAICDKEAVQLSDDILKIVVEFSRGDMRSAVNSIQIIAGMVKPTLDDLYRFFNILPQAKLDEIGYQFTNNEEINLKDILTFFPESASRNFLRQIIYWFLDQPIPDLVLKRIIEVIAKIDLRLTQGDDHEIQIAALFNEIQLIFEEEIYGN